MGDTDKQASAATPAPRKSGGMVTLLWVLLILSIAAGVFMWSVKNKVESLPSIKRLEAKLPQLVELDKKTQMEIEHEGEAINAIDLASAPDTVQGRYVIVDGVVQSTETNVVDSNLAAADFSADAFSGEQAGQYKGYVLDDGVVLVDISGDHKDVKGGQAVRGYGMVVTVDIADIWELPFVGADLKKQFGNIKDTAKSVVFVFSKGIKEITLEEMTRVKGAPGAGGAPPGGMGNAPTGEGTTPPPGEGTTPPPGGGETPPGTPPATPPSTPPGTPPSTPPGTPPSTPPSTPPAAPPGTPPSTPPGTPPSTPPSAPPSTPPSTPPGGTH
jgi:hypothetical protein